METTKLKKNIISIYLFKSYYVVWKPIKLWVTNNSGVCLNRTMQYGNQEIMANHPKIIEV